MVEWAMVETMRTKWAKGLLGSLGLLGLGCVLAHARLAGLPVWGLAALIVFIKMGGRFWLGTAGTVLAILIAGDLLWGQKSLFLLIMAFALLAKALLGAKIFSGYNTAFWAGLLSGAAVWCWRGFPVGAEQIGGAVLLALLAAGFAAALQWLSTPSNWQNVLVRGTDIQPGTEDIPTVSAWLKRKKEQKKGKREQTPRRWGSYWKGIRFEVSVLTVSAVAVMGLSGVEFAGFNAQIIFLGIVVMLMAEFRGSGAAAGAGILLGVLMGGMSVSSEMNSLVGMSSLYGVGGLPVQASQLLLSFGYAGIFGLLGWGCAAFGFLGRLGIIVAYFVFSLIGGYALNVGSLADYSLSAAAAALAYLFLAPRGSAGMSLKEYMMPQIETTVNKVKTLANMFEEVAGGMQAAGEEAEAKEPELSEMMNVLAEKVCYGCAAVNRCWDKEYYRTYQFFLDELEIAETKILADDDASETAGSKKKRLESHCIRQDKIELAAEFIVTQEMERQVWQNHSKASRQALAGQYKSVSQVIHQVAHELFNHRAQSPVQSWKRRHMSKIDFGVATFMPTGKEVSGDAYATLGIGEDRVIFVVCDGMGTGEEAAKLSSSALGILEQLLGTGFDPEGALKALNAIFVLRSPEESFVTLDMAVLDLEKNKIQLFKVGTPPSYIKRGNHVEVLRTSSLPAGVFNEIEVPLVERAFRSDTLVLASDGVVDACQEHGTNENWLEKFLEDAGQPPAQNLANAIIEEAVKLSGGKINDDGIVLVVRQKRERDR